MILEFILGRKVTFQCTVLIFFLFKITFDLLNKKSGITIHISQNDDFSCRCIYMFAKLNGIFYGILEFMINFIVYRIIIRFVNKHVLFKTIFCTKHFTAFIFAEAR